ncbi:MAG: bifunctional glutamate N-acetyltransferase/amino-acid acetyltransferase ArgJ [Actinomycetota bacterium]
MAVRAEWPSGVAAAGMACGIKPGGVPDLGVLVADRPVAWAGSFTTNAAAAACVRWSRSLLGKPARAVVVNSGNANACTGGAGEGAVATTAQVAAAAIGCKASEVLVASTGVIGIPLEVDKIVDALPTALANASSDPGRFAEAILTTDSTTKIAGASHGGASVIGVGKGAAMIAPNMATMLAFLVTDARVDGSLQQVLTSAVEASFNRISIDGCESTNDSVFLLSTEAVDVDTDALRLAVGTVCAELAEQMVRDAEGASRMVRIKVSGAADDLIATELGRAVAQSALWRAAVHGADPNWGRVLAAAGAFERSLDLSRVQLAIGSEVVFADGEPCGSLDLAAKAMDAEEIEVSLSVGAGRGTGEILTADLSPDYVTLNAFGTT